VAGEVKQAGGKGRVGEGYPPLNENPGYCPDQRCPVCFLLREKRPCDIYGCGGGLHVAPINVLVVGHLSNYCCYFV